MRFFLIMDTNGAEIASLVKELKKLGHGVIYWVGADAKVEAEFPDIIFHNFLEAGVGIPPRKVDASEFLPAGEDLLRKLYRTESLISSMINFGQLRAMPALKRRHIYYQMVGYWYGILQKYRPDWVLFTVVPHSVYNYLVYELAKLLGIKTLMFEDTAVSDRALVYYDFWEGSMALKQRMRETSGRDYAVSDLSQDLQTYYHAHQRRTADVAPPYVKRPPPSYLKTISKAWKKRQLWDALKLAFLKRFGRNNLHREYLEVQTAPDFRKKFIYAPLNYQPERSTSPQGGIFTDQILMLEILAASLPPEWVIYIKEHPTQWWRGGVFYSEVRYRGYYRRIAGLKNVFLVPVETDNYMLIDHSEAVATVTGTPGWEAVLRSKPAIIFGYPWYRDCPNLLHVKDVASCRQVLDKVAQGFSINQQEVVNYLKNLDEVAYRCYVDDFDYRASDLSREQYLENFNKAILKEIQSYA